MHNMAMWTLRFLANLAAGALRLALIDLTYYCKSYQRYLGSNWSAKHQHYGDLFFSFVVFYVKKTCSNQLSKIYLFWIQIAEINKLINRNVRTNYSRSSRISARTHTHTHAPGLQISHFSPFTKAYFFLQCQHPANCIPSPLSWKWIWGSSRVLYTLCSSLGFNLLSYFLVAEARRGWGIRMPSRSH